MNTHDPEGKCAAESLAAAISAEIKERSLKGRAAQDYFARQYALRAAHLTDAGITRAPTQKRAHDYVDPQSRPVVETPWALRRARDNAVAQAAHDILTGRQGAYSSAEYLAEIARLEAAAGTRHRDDHPGAIR